MIALALMATVGALVIGSPGTDDWTLAVLITMITVALTVLTYLRTCLSAPRGPP